MRSLVLPLFVCLAASDLAGAQAFGHVVSSTPVMQQVAVPQQVCRQESVQIQHNHGGGAVIGAIAGGAIGNTLGHGGGRALGTLIGIVGGAIIGDQIESHAGSQFQQVQRCTTHMALESRVLHYDVVYEYGGRQYAARLAHDPGPTVLLQVTPVDSVAPPPITSAAPIPEAASITHIHSGVYFVPSIVYRPPVVIVPAPRMHGFAPYPHVAPHRSGRSQGRHPGHNHERRWH